MLEDGDVACRQAGTNRPFQLAALFMKPADEIENAQLERTEIIAELSDYGRLLIGVSVPSPHKTEMAVV